jgi:hypothetical protein
MADSCPYCKTPPCILEDLGGGSFSIGCRQAFVKVAPNEARCEKRPALMCMPTRDDALASWDAWCMNTNMGLKEHAVGN